MAPLRLVEGEKHVMNAQAHLLRYTEGSIEGREPLVYTISMKLLPLWLNSRGAEGGGKVGLKEMF